ncbi:MAG: flagellar basal body L-ring protein FlgH [Pseudomonadota bacterium]
MNRDRLLLLMSLLSLSACQHNALVQPGDQAWQAATPVAVSPAAATPGAIFQAGRGANLFVDHRASQVGDIVTINLVEKTDASKQSTTTTGKDSSVAIPTGTLLGGPMTFKGRDLLNTQLSSEQDFKGQGASSQSNRLSGSITVTVAEVLANGNLRVRGEKWVTLNQGEEFIRLAGTIRPVDVAPDNSVPSWKVADARITYSGKGMLNDANAMGWLARLFQSVLAPL